MLNVKGVTSSPKGLAQGLREGATLHAIKRARPSLRTIYCRTIGRISFGDDISRWPGILAPRGR